MEKQRYRILHVGKTGGSSIGKLLKTVRAQGESYPVSLLRHKKTLQGMLKQSPKLNIGFVVRDPADRFVSGFNSRMRAGRPAHTKYTWSAEEAAAYSYFPTANDLAEALLSTDERLLSAAQFSMQAINHLRRGYEFHLGSVRTIQKYQASIYAVCDLKQLDSQIYRFLEPAGVSKETIDANFARRHEAPKEQKKASVLSDLARENLKTYWATEYEIYQYCLDELCTPS